LRIKNKSSKTTASYGTAFLAVLTNKNKPVNISKEAKNKIESPKEGKMIFRN
jgi:hypothetical protein